MDTLTLTNLLILLALIPVAVGVAWGVLRGLDKLTGKPFADVINIMASDPRALSMYYSARIISVCYLAAELTSRFI